jgi:hypothetical protein
MFLIALGAAVARQVAQGRKLPQGCAQLPPQTVDSQSRDCPQLIRTNHTTIVGAAQAAGRSEAGAGARHRWHAAQRNLTTSGGAQTLKQVVAPPYCLSTQPPTIAGTVHEAQGRAF